MAGLRLGLLGGAFDPPHLAHVSLARSAISQLQLDRMWIMPTGQPWHRSRPPSDASHRLAMCQLAFAEIEKVTVDDRETRRQGPTYTVDTVRELQAQWPGADWFLIIGADQARRFSTWHEWQELQRMVHIVVADRDPEAGQWQNTGLEQALRLRFEPMDISATAIRSCVAQNLMPVGLQPQVLDYIQSHQLYKVQST